jgi:phage FluMu protein Com
VQKIECTHTDEYGKQCGRFLARLSGGVLEIYCARCKEYHPVAVVDLVKLTIAEIPPNGKGPEVRLFL